MALQFGTPDTMRGQVVSVQLLCSNLIGLSVGPVAVSMLSQQAGLGLGPAIRIFLIPVAIVGMIAAALARRARSADAREIWRAAQAGLDFQALVFIDETGTNTSMTPTYG